MGNRALRPEFLGLCCFVANLKDEVEMSKKKILVVDDEPDFVKMAKIRLEANNYAVVTAFDGQQGLKKAREEEPDVILLDIMMPNKDGYTMLRELKEDEKIKTIPVIILTAKGGMKELFEIEGVSDYIVKPFDSEDLLLRISRSLKKA